MSEAVESRRGDEVRRRDLPAAGRHLAIGFFSSVCSHRPGMHGIEGEGGDLGSSGGTIIETVKAAREMFAKNPDIDADTEALLRAKFATYLRERGES